MDYRLTAKIEPTAAIALMLRDGQSVRRHAAYPLLPEPLQRYLASIDESLELEDGTVKTLISPEGKKVILIGASERRNFNQRKAILAVRRMIAAAKTDRIQIVEVFLDDVIAPGERPETAAEMLATQGELANFEFNGYREIPKKGWSFVEKVFCHAQGNTKRIGEAMARGKVIGEEINKARRLSNTPGGDMTPELLASSAAWAAKDVGIGVKVFDEAELRHLGMGGVLGVAKGSSEPPRFIVLEYRKGKKKDRPVVLVGKGVTFDTGGLNLKPSDKIYEMHLDMSGAAAVIHTMTALARLKVKKNIIGLIPAVENMPSGSSYHPGDILRTISGKTIEVLDTDAEGRIILADALGYAKQYAPRLIVDIATLTGAAMSALGQRASALFSTNDRIAFSLQEAGERTGDLVWPLPLWEEFESEIKGTFGDVANIGKTKYGGAITGAVFLWQFVKQVRHKGQEAEDEAKPAHWVHLDIAPRMTTIEGEYLAKGSAGASINLLVHFLERY